MTLISKLLSFVNSRYLGNGEGVMLKDGLQPLENIDEVLNPHWVNVAREEDMPLLSGNPCPEVERTAS